MWYARDEVVPLGLPAQRGVWHCPQKCPGHTTAPHVLAAHEPFAAAAVHQIGPAHDRGAGFQTFMKQQM